MPFISSRRPWGNLLAHGVLGSLGALMIGPAACTSHANVSNEPSAGENGSTASDTSTTSGVGGASGADVTSGTVTTAGPVTTTSDTNSTTVGAVGSTGMGGMSAAGGATTTMASTDGGVTAGGAGGASSVGGAGGSAGAGGTPGSGAGGVGGAPCDTSPGMAMQFAEGVIDQMTGNLGSDGPSGDGPRTLELWAKFISMNSWTAEQTIIELGRRGNAGDMVWGIDMSGYSGNGGRFGPYTNGVTDNNGSAGPFYEAPADVGWLHLSWAYEGGGGEMVFTVNGEQLPIQDPGSNYTLDLTPGIVTLGASQSFGATGWDGVMDEVRIWNVYRSPQEIADTMNVFLTGDEAGLVAYYNFDDSDGTYVDDVKATPSHRLEPCTAGNDDRCTATNNAMPTVVASDIPGPFTCAQ